MDVFNTYTDAELLRKIAQGDEAAFRQFFFKWKGKLFSFLFQLTSERALAEDIVQEIFMKVWQKRAALTEVENADAYIYRVAHNRAIDELRRLARRPVPIEIATAQKGLSIPSDQEIRIKEIQQIFQKALENLSPQQRRVFILHREEGLKHEEIAQQLNLSVSTVQNHMFRAMESIRNFFRLADPDREAYLLLGLCFIFS